MKVAEIKIERMKLADLQPHPRNPRKHPEPGSAEWATLKASLEHDYYDPLVWNRLNKKLVSGHLRTKVLIEAGYTEADVSVVEYDEETHIARMMSANKMTGENDLPGLKDLLQEIDTGAFDMDLTGFTADEIEKKITDFWIPDVEELLKELDLNESIAKPAWVVMRFSADNIGEVEKALAQLEMAAKVERSYDRQS